MKKISTLLLMAVTSATAYADINVIYGPDNRKDIYQTSDAKLLTLAQSTAAMIPVNAFAKGAKDKMFDLKDIPTLEENYNVCPGEAFAEQPTAGGCSGFLVSPDTLVTAGHCYMSFSTPENVCKGFAWVFDYSMTSAKSDPTKNISINNIYLCKKIIKAEFNGQLDYAIIKLNRPVTGRQPLKIRTTGKVGKGSLTVIGHPSGLPTKISDGGKMINNNYKTMFVTTLDTFQGNSGSAVFDTETGIVEGILVQGKTDYVASIKGNEASCKVVNKCDDDGKNCASGKEEDTPPGEMVFRITEIAKYLK